ncbi:MAG: hypothetical protein ACJATF_002466, partial [Flavobacteriales bacterium]
PFTNDYYRLLTVNNHSLYYTKIHSSLNHTTGHSSTTQKVKSKVTKISRITSTTIEKPLEHYLHFFKRERTEARATNKPPFLPHRPLSQNFMRLNTPLFIP